MAWRRMPASIPGKGASAIHELAHQIVAVAALQDPDRGVTLNVGRISGGSRTNVVADLARASIDVRVPTMADAVRVEAVAARVASAYWRGRASRFRAASTVRRSNAGAGVLRLYEMARDVARDLGRDLAEGAAGGGSDGNFTAAIGVPTLDGLGPRGDGAHALHEHVELDDLAWRAAFLAAAVEPAWETTITLCPTE